MRFSCKSFDSQTVNPVTGTIYSNAIEMFLTFSYGIASDIAKASFTSTVDVQDVFAAAAASVDSETNQLTAATHGWRTGLPGKVSGSNVPAPLAAGVTYYAVKDSANAIRLATSEANAYAGTVIDLTSPIHAVNPVDTFVASVTATTDWNVGTSVVTSTAHGLITAVQGQFTTSSALPTGLSLLTDYWIIRVDDNSYKIAASEADAYAGTAIAFSDVGAGIQTFTPVNPVAKNFSPANVNVGTEVVTITAHGFFTGYKVRVVPQADYARPAPLAAATDYYVIDASADTIKFAASYSDAIAGTAINLTTTGSALITDLTFTPDTLAYPDKTFIDGGVDATADTIAVGAHGYFTGLKVRLVSASGAYPGGLAASTDYFVIDVSAGVIKLATSEANALSGTAIDITDTGNVPSVVTTLQYTLEQPGTIRESELTWFDITGSAATTTSDGREFWSEKSAVPYTYMRLKHVCTGGSVTVVDSFHKKHA